MADVGKELASLPKMAKAELLDLWKESFGKRPAKGMRRDLLIRFLAYRIQEQAYGGLKPETHKRLDDLARRFEANPNASISDAPQIKPGTRLIRDWRGQSHSVTVLEKGYEHAGKRYASLSQIARMITGTRWSGPLFFGIKKTKTNGRDDER
jgi:hypothetical protein